LLWEEWVLSLSHLPDAGYEAEGRTVRGKCDFDGCCYRGFERDLSGRQSGDEDYRIRCEEEPMKDSEQRVIFTVLPSDRKLSQGVVAAT